MFQDFFSQLFKITELWDHMVTCWLFSSVHTTHPTTTSPTHTPDTGIFDFQSKSVSELNYWIVQTNKTKKMVVWTSHHVLLHTPFLGGYIQLHVCVAAARASQTLEHTLLSCFSPFVALYIFYFCSHFLVYLLYDQSHASVRICSKLWA